MSSGAAAAGGEGGTTNSTDGDGDEDEDANKVTVRYFVRLTAYTDFTPDARRWNAQEIVLYRGSLYGQEIPDYRLPRAIAGYAGGYEEAVEEAQEDGAAPPGSVGIMLPSPLSSGLNFAAAAAAGGDGGSKRFGKLAPGSGSLDGDRPPANTKLGPSRIHELRVRGGNMKYRAMRLDHGNFSWGSEVVSRKARVLDVVYNASNNELVRTKTLVKNCIVQIDAAPFKTWYEAHYGVKVGQKKLKKTGEAAEEGKKSKSVLKKLAERQTGRVLDPQLDDAFSSGRLYACISSRPGQSGRSDGYILEGKELDFYVKKLRAKKGSKA